MAGKGGKVTFHGSFKSKPDAVSKEKKVKGSFIRRVKTKQGVRYVVMTRAR